MRAKRLTNAAAMSAILAATTAAAQLPNLGTAAILPGDASVSTASGAQTSVALAAGGGVTLAVWGDTRAGTGDILGLRMDASGAALDAVPFEIDLSPGDQTDPQVVWNGQTFLVAWVSQEPTQYYYEDRIQAVRVSPQGQVLDATPITLPETASTFALATDGTDFLIVKQGPGPVSSIDMMGFRISSAGQLLDPTGVLLTPGSYFMIYNFDLAFAGGTWLFAWEQFSGSTGWDVVGRRFTAALQPVDPAPVALVSTPKTEVEPRLAANASEFFLVYWHQDTYWSEGVLGRRFDSELNPLDPTPLSISGTGTSMYQPWPVVTWDGEQWIAAWSGVPAVRAARISAAGALLDPGGVPLNAAPPLENQYSPAVSPLPGGGVRVAWSDIRNQGYDVFGAGFTANGLVSPEAPLAVGASAHGESKVVPNGAGYLTVARSATSANDAILAWRVDAQGSALDAEPFVAAQGGSNLGQPSAAWNGSLYLLAWSDSSVSPIQVVGRRMLPDGTFVDPVPFPILNGAAADVAAVGDLFLVTASFAPSNPQYVFTYGARVSGSTGAVLDPTALLLGGSFSVRPRVAACGDRWVVVNESHITHDENQANVTVRFVDTDGSAGNLITVGTANVQNWGSADIASSGTTALAVWEYGTNWINNDVYARSVNADGTLGPPAVNLTLSENSGQLQPAVGWDGTQYLVAYESYQNNPLFYDQRPDVYAQRVSELGAALDVNGFAVWDADIWASNPEVAGLGGGNALFSAAVYEQEPYQALRAEVRSIQPDGSAVSYCTAGTSASGCRALLSASGTPSASSSSGFLLSAATVEGAKDGLFFFGVNGRQASSWGPGTSYQCVAPPVKRAGLLAGSGTAGLCDGSFVQDLNALWCPTCPKPLANPGAGTTVQAQLWYRDPKNPGGQTTSFSDAIEFLVGS